LAVLGRRAFRCRGWRSRRIDALASTFSADEVAIIERMLRDLNGTIPDAQMVEEIALALAIHRRR
jgi:hypothetical protein